jgi:hypothetical protein
MAVQVPTEEQLREVAADVGLALTNADVKSFIELMRPSVAAYNVVDAMPDNLPLLHAEPGLARINGLFRHGWMIAPALVERQLDARVHRAKGPRRKGIVMHRGIALGDGRVLHNTPFNFGLQFRHAFLPRKSAQIRSDEPRRCQYRWQQGHQDHQRAEAVAHWGGCYGSWLKNHARLAITRMPASRTIAKPVAQSCTKSINCESQLEGLADCATDCTADSLGDS